HPPPRAGLRVAKGRADMALKPAKPTLPASMESRDLVEPIVVPNALWVPDTGPATTPAESENTHLREYGLTDAGRRDDARWSGALDIIPTKADYILDLIGATSLWPLLSGLACCAFEMMSSATSKNDIDRWGMF